MDVSNNRYRVYLHGGPTMESPFGVRFVQPGSYGIVQNFPYATHLTLASWKPSHWSPRPRSVDQDLRVRISKCTPIWLPDHGT